jgi:hypothetical protein
VDFLEVISELVVGTRQALPKISEVIGSHGLPAANRLDPAHWLSVALHDE